MFSQQVINFNKTIEYRGKLPTDIQIMNPFRENQEVLEFSELFYSKFYADAHTRNLILGINPGRLGAGATGIPFTDTKRLKEFCKIDTGQMHTYEPSSVFVYDVIKAFGGAKAFYSRFYINSVCPLGFIQKNKKGNWVNCNYYEYPELFEATKAFNIASLKKQLEFGIDQSMVFILGKENARFFKKINEEEKVFKKLIVLDHPRYVAQYKLKEKERYVAKYLELLSESTKLSSVN